jgi:hypothetical protein
MGGGPSGVGAQPANKTMPNSIDVRKMAMNMVVNERDIKHLRKSDFLIQFTNYQLHLKIPRMDIEAQYNKALDYLYSFVDYSLKHSSELAKAEFNLDRMYALMEGTRRPAEHVSHHPRGRDEGEGLGVARLCASGVEGGGI